ncbi:hypothetical protein IFM47457_04234 [Aspergillus lentulus]|nr:hypothetical protein IFM47457_04234 [Aspergillus lentulus]
MKYAGGHEEVIRNMPVSKVAELEVGEKKSRRRKLNYREEDDVPRLWMKQTRDPWRDGVWRVAPLFSTVEFKGHHVVVWKIERVDGGRCLSRRQTGDALSGLAYCLKTS